MLSPKSKVNFIRAVALEYDKRNGLAPSISAKGESELARKIMAKARFYGIPIHRNPELVNRLCGLEVADQIPQDSFFDVARLLAKLNQSRHN